MLGSEHSLTFVDNLAAVQRQQALNYASLLLSWNFPQEILPEDYPSLERVTFLQLVTAGADHMPFAGLSERILVVSNASAYAALMAEHVLAMTLALIKRVLPEH